MECLDSYCNYYACLHTWIYIYVHFAIVTILWWGNILCRWDGIWKIILDHHHYSNIPSKWKSAKTKCVWVCVFICVWRRRSSNSREFIDTTPYHHYHHKIQLCLQYYYCYSRRHKNTTTSSSSSEKYKSYMGKYGCIYLYPCVCLQCKEDEGREPFSLWWRYGESEELSSELNF